MLWGLKTKAFVCNLGSSQDERWTWAERCPWEADEELNIATRKEGWVKCYHNLRDDWEGAEGEPWGGEGGEGEETQLQWDYPETSEPKELLFPALFENAGEGPQGSRKTGPEWPSVWLGGPLRLSCSCLRMCSVSIHQRRAIAFHRNSIVFSNPALVGSVMNGLFIRHAWFYVSACKVSLCNSPCISLTLLGHSHVNRQTIVA